MMLQEFSTALAKSNMSASHEPNERDSPSMRHTLFPLLLAIFLAVGCAHSPQSAPSLEPSIESSQPRPVVLASASGQTSLNTPERSAISAAAGADGMGKGNELEAQTLAGAQGAQESPQGPAASGSEGADAEYSDDANAQPAATIADPWEPFNRAMHTFNDRLYFWLFKPVAQGYNMVVPEPARVSVSNFFSNLRAPVRLVNCVLQVNPIGAATELFRFMINSTVGIAGLFDPAGGEEINLKRQDVDLGQTLGVWGMGQGIYIVWPIIGPSSSRDTAGIVGDYFLYPISYLDPLYVWAGVRGYEALNEVSLRIGDYEAITEAAIDPYIAFRDAFVQYRLKKVEGQPAPFRQWY
jgi:phospholipid-binding lipoprotein MlaA